MSQSPMDTTPPLPPPAEPTPPPAIASVTPSAAPRESALSPVSQVFLGPDGPYPATRWLIYLALAFVVFVLFNFFVAAFRPRAATSLWWRMISEFGMMLSAIVPGFIMAHVEGHPFGDFGLPASRAFRRNFWVGVFWGLASLTILMFVLRLAGAFSFGTVDLHGLRILKFAAFYAVFFLTVAFFEEFLTRGYSLWVLSQGLHFWPAAALLSCFFGAMHLINPGESRVGIAAICIIGFFWCLTLRRTGSLWWAVGFHMSWDWGESFLYSIPDSGTTVPGHLLSSSLHGPEWLTGGSVGPEGSYLLFPLFVALWILFSRFYAEINYKNHEEKLISAEASSGTPSANNPQLP